MHTVAAGGGSILLMMGARFRVGPGPAPAPTRGLPAYGRGGPATVTDANVMLGKLVPRVLPQDLRADAGPAA